MLMELQLMIIYYLCNKNSINLVKASNINSSSSIVNLSQSPQGGDYYPGDYVGKYSLEVLYVRSTGEQDSQGQDIYLLYISKIVALMECHMSS